MAPDDECSDLVGALQQIVGTDAVLIDPETCLGYTVDWTQRWFGQTPAVVLPASTEETAKVIDICRSFGAAWVPQGGNTGLVGGGVPVDGEVVISTRRLRAIGPIEPGSMQVSVGAGVTLTELGTAAAAHGLSYGIDFGARDLATIGGTIATNAGGNSALCFGMTRAQIVGIEAVLPDGSVVRRMNGLMKDNTGFNVAQLLCGSEGTLGVITAARLQLRPMRSPRITVALGVRSMREATAVLGALGTVDSVVACEVMRGHDIEALRSVRDWVIPEGWKAPWAMLIEAVGPRAFDELGAAIDGIAAVLVGEPAVVTGEKPYPNWWRVRDAHGEIAAMFGPTLKLDVSVPIERLAEFVEGLDESVAAAAPVMRTVVFGHLGDGNLHINVAAPIASFSAVETSVLERVLAFGGVVSAEHGIGRMKREWLVRDRGLADVDAMRRIKRAFDPRGLANPNVLLPAEEAPVA